VAPGLRSQYSRRSRGCYVGVGSYFGGVGFSHDLNQLNPAMPIATAANIACRPAAISASRSARSPFHGVRVAGLQKPLRRPAAGALGDLFTLVAGGFVVDGVFFSSFAVMSRYVSVTGLI
jgi:hypothetical protein